MIPIDNNSATLKKTKVDQIITFMDPIQKTKLIDEITHITLPKEIASYAKKYQAAGGQRDLFIVKWLYYCLKYFTLSCVNEEEKERIITLKIISTISVLIFDDFGDEDQDLASILEAMKLPYHSHQIQIENISSKNRDLFALAMETWQYYLSVIETYPRFAQFKDIIVYNYTQMVNSCLHSCLKNLHPAFINYVEAEIYEPHTMFMVFFTDTDLVATKKIITKEIGLMRELFWRSQRMGRIANCIATWQRELNSNDLSSNFLSFSVIHQNIDPDLLLKQKNNIKHLVSIKETESYFYSQWQTYYTEILNLGANIKTFDVEQFLYGIEVQLMSYLACKGSV